MSRHFTTGWERKLRDDKGNLLPEDQQPEGAKSTKKLRQTKTVFASTETVMLAPAETGELKRGCASG